MMSTGEQAMRDGLTPHLDAEARSRAVRRCPYLGLQSDPTVTFTGPAEQHRCHVARGRQRIGLDHQTNFCLTSAFGACSRFEPLPELSVDRERSRRRRISPLSFLRETFLPGVFSWVLLLAVGAIAAYLYLTRPMLWRGPSDGAPIAVALPTVSPTASPTTVPTSTLVPTAVPATSTPAPPATLVPGRAQAAIVPASNAVGWVSSAESGNHFGDRNLHAGVFEGDVYHGAMRFSLVTIPAGSKIEQATVELMGLNPEHLAPELGGTWALRLLASEPDEHWPSSTYERIHGGAVVDIIGPELRAADLGSRKVNVFIFTPAQRAELERRLEQEKEVSFRLDGPSEGDNDLFTWDTGYGGGFGSRPVLRMIYYPPPTPTPFVVTAVPSPANALTAAADAATATYQATVMGTPTPLPPNIVTATPPFIIVPTETPGNVATAQYLAAVAAAEILLYGTPTPLPDDAWTATPAPTPTPTPTYVIITNPQSVLTVAAMVASGTGTPTPLPPNWVTPVIILNTPTPANLATAAFLASQATAQAMVYGTQTPLPPNVWTATPVPLATATPVLLSLGQITATPTPTSTPSDFPAALKGRILFKSDRFGGTDILVMDPDGGNVALLTSGWAYNAAQAQAAYSPDGRFVVYQAQGRHGLDLFVHDIVNDQRKQVTSVGRGVTYDAVWSPDSWYIAFVSNQDGDDDIFVVTRDGGGMRQLTQNQWEWDKHPAYSPDGQRIVYYSNAETGRNQIWLMNADGSEKRNISNNAHSDWDPVWIHSAPVAAPPAPPPQIASSSSASGSVAGAAPALTITGANKGKLQVGLKIDDMEIYGQGFQNGATVQLRREGQADIPGLDMSLSGDSVIRCRFDLRGLQIPRDERVLLHVENPDGQVAERELWLIPPGQSSSSGSPPPSH